MQGMTWLWVVVAAFVLFGLWRMRKGARPMAPGTQVVQALEEFSQHMEDENERLIEMVSLLRQKIDGLELEQRQAGQYLRQQTDELAARASRLESQVERHALLGEPSQSAIPSYLSARYRTVAERLLAGHPQTAIMKELDLGQGEVDLVARLLESDQESI